MSYVIDGKVYRNLQEQVAENTKHINELAYGDVYLGPYLSTDAIPQQELIKGNIFLIGKVEDGYDMMRCLETDTRTFQNLGKFGAQGPKGDKGDKGEQGEQGGIGNQGPKGDTGNGIARIFLDQVIGQEKHYVIEFTNGDRFSYVVSDGQQGIQGIQGPVGPQGPQGEVGPVGPVANPLYEHNVTIGIYDRQDDKTNVNAGIWLRLNTKSSESINTFEDLCNTIKSLYGYDKYILATGYWYDTGDVGMDPVSRISIIQFDLNDEISVGTENVSRYIRSTQNGMSISDTVITLI